MRSSPCFGPAVPALDSAILARMRRAARLAWVAGLMFSASVASGQQDTRPDDVDKAASGAEAGSAAPALALDKLLNPRAGLPRPSDVTRPGGKDRETWERQFAEAKAEVAQLRARVDESQRRMRDAAGETNYSYSPAGGGETYDPDVLKTRAQLQRDRQSLKAAERRLRDLKVEASLAGVPSEWQTGEKSPSREGD